MADFTSVQSGNWNDGATWGNSSPGTKGTDWPGLAGDTATVSAGHTVVYNVSEDNGLGGVTLNGKLSFDDSSSRKLVIEDADLSVNSGGELEIGADTNNFPKEYTAEILFDTSSNNAHGLNISNGGKLTVYGASDYCSVYEDSLADDAENTDGDADIKTVNDMSSIWHIGDELTIKVEKDGDSSSHNDAIKIGTIQSFNAGNIITLDINITAESGVGSTWIASVVNVTRNVRFGKLGASTAIGNYNSNRPFFKDSNSQGSYNCAFSHAVITGFYNIDSDYDFNFINSVFRNGYYGFYYGTGHTVSGNVYSNNNGFHYGTGYTISGNVYSNNNGFNYGTGHTISGKIGYDDNDISLPNTTDFVSDGFTKHFLLNCKMPSSGLIIARNKDKYIIRLKCEHYDRVAHAYKIFDNMGDIIKTACDGAGDSPGIDPDGGNGYCVELSNIQSKCNGNNPLLAFHHRVWAEASVSKTYTYKVQTTYASLASGELFLTGKYLDEASGGHLATITNSPAISQRADNTDWSQQLSVTINPSQEGWVDLTVELKQYENLKKVYIWPAVEIS